jgi:hypothetical protein
VIALAEGSAPVAETPRKPRSPRRPGGQGASVAPVRVAKSRDAQKTKVSFYIDSQAAEKLAVAAIIRRVDQSDLVNELLTRSLSSVTFYDRSQSTRTPGEPLTVTEFGTDPAA